jgi:hypothetical protein
MIFHAVSVRPDTAWKDLSSSPIICLTAHFKH